MRYKWIDEKKTFRYRKFYCKTWNFSTFQLIFRESMQITSYYIKFKLQHRHKYWQHFYYIKRLFRWIIAQKHGREIELCMLTLFIFIRKKKLKRKTVFHAQYIHSKSNIKVNICPRPPVERTRELYILYKLRQTWEFTREKYTLYSVLYMKKRGDIVYLLPGE